MALALLFAPKSGKETTELIKNKLSDIPETVKESTADRKKVYAETWKSRKGRPKVSPTYFE